MNAPFTPNKQIQVSVSPTGKMHLPAELRKKLSLEKGGKLFVHEGENGITLMTTKAHLDSLAALIAPQTTSIA